MRASRRRDQPQEITRKAQDGVKRCAGTRVGHGRRILPDAFVQQRRLRNARIARAQSGGGARLAEIWAAGIIADHSDPRQVGGSSMVGRPDRLPVWRLVTVGGRSPLGPLPAIVANPPAQPAFPGRGAGARRQPLDRASGGCHVNPSNQGRLETRNPQRFRRSPRDRACHSNTCHRDRRRSTTRAKR